MDLVDAAIDLETLIRGRGLDPRFLEVAQALKLPAARDR
jgi:hypothetical protein